MQKWKLVPRNQTNSQQTLGLHHGIKKCAITTCLHSYVVLFYGYKHPTKPVWVYFKDRYVQVAIKSEGALVCGNMQPRAQEEHRVKNDVIPKLFSVEISATRAAKPHLHNRPPNQYVVRTLQPRMEDWEVDLESLAC